MKETVDKIFELVIERDASDIVFVAGAAPTIWVSGRMQQIEAPKLCPEDIESSFLTLLNDQQRSRLQKTGDLDFSLGRQGIGRFRINVHRQRGSWAVAMRFIPDQVPSFDQLKLPEKVLQLADLPRGLVLITGGSGSGKSTTLAAMIDYMNHVYPYHIVTLEDPIEFTFQHRCAIIEQREIGTDCPSFASALRHVVRQRPDVILVGEMRDLETTAAVLTAAETGHLVIASLHTVSAVETINRIIDVFPANQQAQVRVQLSDTLQGVVCQMLFHDQIDGAMVPAVEIMMATSGIRRGIRNCETERLNDTIEAGRALGMQAMDASIASLVAAGRISSSEAIAKAQNAEKVVKLIEQ